jgi:ribosomal-protein-alanine N-acetyltransferase
MSMHQLWIDPDVRRYLGDDIAITRERAAGVVRAHFESVATRGIGYWALHPADEEPLVGFCGFRGIEETPEIEIVHGLLPAYWGRGLATEAARAALNYLWETAHTRVYARTDSPNEKSIAGATQVGFSSGRLAQPHAYVSAGTTPRLEESLKTTTPAANVNRPNPT